MQAYYLAVDIGASSGRHILGHVENGRIMLEEIYRFDNVQIVKNGHDCWDWQNLWQHILNGLKACKAAGKVPKTMGIDTWAVDFILLDANNAPVSDMVAYRDARTEGIQEALAQSGVLCLQAHYAKTGIQNQAFNTIYQLAALQKECPQQLAAAQHFLMVPEYFNFLLTGVMQNEYTNATSTALVNAHTNTWDDEIIASLGLPCHIFGALAMPGTAVGDFTKEVQAAVGFNCTVILPATHDTGSAFLAVPARDENAVYISSGTWSLLGVENTAPITSPESCRANFTNEGGYAYRTRYIKNIMGLWLIQSIRRELNGTAYVSGKQPQSGGHANYSYADLEALAKEETAFAARIDVSDSRFLAPDSMIAAVKQACAESGQPVPQNIGQIMQTVYTSLAQSYATAILELQGLTGKTYTAINIVGGGSKDGYLNALTAKATGLPVYAGPTEGTALGNLMVQFLAAGEYPNLQAARNAIPNSLPIKEIIP